MKAAISILVLWVSMGARAQGVVGSIFNQGQTQVKDYLKQIAAYQVYLTYLKQGYGIVKNGAHTIGSLKSADLLLQTAALDSLKMVNPRIRSYPKVPAIIRMEQQMVVARSQASGELSAALFTPQELAALKQTMDSYAAEGQLDLQELQLLTSGNTLRMSDDQRISGIDRLYDKVFGAYNHQEQLLAAASALAAQRRQEGKDAGTLQSLTGQ